MLKWILDPKVTPVSRPVWLWVVLALFVTAAALLAGPWGFTSPAAPAQPVPAKVTSTRPVRQPKLRAQLELAGFSYRCSDCHRHFPSPPETTRSLTQHRDIELRHGLNTRCFNCHHLTNRDAFVDDWGREIPYDQPQLLCAKCHGTVYRDWLAGAHGRTDGHWEASRGPGHRLRCIECHDPHHPPFQSLQPAPPPNTLRMGDQEVSHPKGGVQNPLQVYHPARAPAALPASGPAEPAGEVSP